MYMYIYVYMCVYIYMYINILPDEHYKTVSCRVYVKCVQR